MSNEEAIKILKGAIKKPNTEDGYMGQALTMAIKALEQQTCEDAVSRAAVLDIFADNADATRPYSTAWEEVKALPPVNPQHTDVEIQKMQELEQAELEKAYELGKAEEPKTGHWIEHERNGKAYIECSGCLSWFLRSHLLRNSYCPNCGAKMVEEQESEVSE